MSSMLLPIALGGTFGAVLLTALAMNLSAVSRRKAVRLLESQVRTATVQVTDLREHQLATSVTQRLLLPLLGRIGIVARRLAPLGASRRIERRLVLAGNPAGWDAQRVSATKLIGGAAGLALGVLFLRKGITGPTIVFAAAAAGMGYTYTDFLFMSKARKRQAQIRRDLPDTMDLLTITVEAGLSFDSAVAQVAANDDGPIAYEFNRMLKEVRLGAPRVDALRNMATRTEVDEIDSFVTSMVQAEVFGVSVTKVLRAQSHELRRKRRQLAERKAQQLAVKMIFPLIFCILPSMFVVTLGPAVIGLLDFFVK